MKGVWKRNIAMLAVLVVVAAGMYALGYWSGSRQVVITGGTAAYYPPGYNNRHFDYPSVFAPCYASAEKIDAYFAKYAPAYKGSGAAIVKVCKTYGYDPAFICSLMMHEGGSKVLGTWAQAPYYNPFSWGVSDSNPSYVSYGSYTNAISKVVPEIYALYHAPGGPFNHGTALLGMAVKYVGGGGNQVDNDVVWANSIEAMMQQFYTFCYDQTTALKVKYVREGVFTLDGTQDYWTRPMTRQDMLWLMEKYAEYHTATGQ